MEDKNVLAVDDTPENLKLLGHILSDKYSLNFATNGAKALELVSIKKPDLILLDIMMPEMDGFEVCKILKSKPETSEIPVVFLTAKSDRESVIRGLSLGAVDYLIKPFEKDDVLIRIQKIFQESSVVPDSRGSHAAKISSEGTSELQDMFIQNRFFCYDTCMVKLRQGLLKDVKKFRNELQETFQPFLLAKEYIRKIEELLITKKIRISKKYLDNKKILRTLNDLQKIRVSSEMQNAFSSINDAIEHSDKRLTAFSKLLIVDTPHYGKEEILFSKWMSSFLESYNLEINFTQNAADESYITGNSFLLNQIFLALIDNSWDNQKGHLTAEDVLISVTQKGKMLMILYSDNGAAPLSTQESLLIFTEGYTTKDDRKGMGLSAVRYILKNYFNGDIQVIDNARSFCLELRIPYHNQL
ncbi:response regulator [Oceanispirochaeta crateris]|nr:response regulator [Oceanispirochaeta crateris]